MTQFPIKDSICGRASSGNCVITHKCQDCKTYKNNDVIEIEIKNTFIQMYKWTFDSVWSENYDYTMGSSQLEGLFKPDDDLR